MASYTAVRVHVCSLANIDDTTFIPSALKVRQIRGEKGIWFSCSLINRPLFIFVCLQGQGHNIKLPKKQFPVGSEEVRWTVGPFVLPSKFTCRNSAASRSVHAEPPLTCLCCPPSPSLSPAVWHCHVGLTLKLGNCSLFCVAQNLGSKWQVIIAPFSKIESLAWMPCSTFMLDL